MKFLSKARIRPLTAQDAAEALKLYNNLTAGPRAHDPAAFDRVVNHEGTYVFGTFKGDALIAMLTLHLLPNVTWDARPYAVIENVITKAAYRRKGYGRKLMQAAIEHAWSHNAHKIMLLTGTRLGARAFYEAVGFSADEKHGMVLHSP